jgi:hypothetical protein
VKALFTKPRKAPTLKTKLESMIHEKWEAAIRPIWHIFRTRFGGCDRRCSNFRKKKRRKVYGFVNGRTNFRSYYCSTHHRLGLIMDRRCTQSSQIGSSDKLLLYRYIIHSFDGIMPIFISLFERTSCSSFQFLRFL